MRVFPQLATGAMAQFPLARVRRVRTVRNAMPDGRRVVLADSEACETEWRLEYSELSDGELDGLERFFKEMEGRLHTFVFLDPAANLLCWSDALDHAVWEKGPLLSPAGNVADPFGGMRAWRVTNGGALPAAAAQTLNVPAWYYYCLSVWARCDGNTAVTLLRGGERSAMPVTERWTRLVFPSQVESADESVRFGVEIAAGTRVELFGMQVEPQTGASMYKSTASRSGVYGNARFAEDFLEVTTQGPGRHSCALGIIHGDHF